MWCAFHYCMIACISHPSVHNWTKAEPTVGFTPFVVSYKPASQGLKLGHISGLMTSVVECHRSTSFKFCTSGHTWSRQHSQNVFLISTCQNFQVWLTRRLESCKGSGEVRRGREAKTIFRWEHEDGEKKIKSKFISKTDGQKSNEGVI